MKLNNAEAVADILGGPDIHVDEGSTLRLECRLRRATENPAFVFWYVSVVSYYCKLKKHFF